MTEHPPPDDLSATDEPVAGTDEPMAGAGLFKVDVVGTVVLAVACIAGIVAPDATAGFSAGTAAVLLAVGSVLFLWGFAAGVSRSRTEQITMPGLFLLTGTAPKAVRFRFRALLAVQVVLAVAAASIRPFTPVAFTVLAPMLGVGAMAAWGGRHGTYFPRDDGPR